MNLNNPIAPKLPCCRVLKHKAPLCEGTGAAAYIHIGFLSTQSVSILATLPASTEFGDYDTFVGEVHIPNIGGFGAQLFPTPMDPTTFAVTLNLPSTAMLTPDSSIVVRPASTNKGITGPIILEGMCGVNL